MIDGSEKRNRQLAFELQNSHCENSSNPQSILPLRWAKLNFIDIYPFSYLQAFFIIVFMSNQVYGSYFCAPYLRTLNLLEKTHDHFRLSLMTRAWIKYTQCSESTAAVHVHFVGSITTRCAWTESALSWIFPEKEEKKGEPNELWSRCRNKIDIPLCMLGDRRKSNLYDSDFIKIWQSN